MGSPFTYRPSLIVNQRFPAAQPRQNTNGIDPRGLCPVRIYLKTAGGVQMLEYDVEDKPIIDLSELPSMVINPKNKTSYHSTNTCFIEFITRLPNSIYSAKRFERLPRYNLGTPKVAAVSSVSDFCSPRGSVKWAQGTCNSRSRNSFTPFSTVFPENALPGSEPTYPISAMRTITILKID